MAYLLDTCALSELIVKAPNRRAREALLSLPREAVFISVVTVGEIKKGLEELSPSPRRQELENWCLQQVLGLYSDHTVVIDSAVAIRWGILAADLRKRGLSMPWNDSWIAATALAHGFVVVTRNEADFAHCGIRLFNPWK